MQTLRALAIAAISLVAFAHEAETQQPIPRIAIIEGIPSAEQEQVLRDEFRAGGYDVGRNLQVEYRYTYAQFDRLPALMAELVALRPDIIVAGAPQTALAVRAAAPATPLVFLTVADPVGLGLVPNLAHPGGNVTGSATTVPEGFGAKALELLKTVAPATSPIAILVNPTNQMHQREQLKFPDTAARRLGVELVTVDATKGEELEAAFEKARARGVEAIDVFGDALTLRESTKIANLALQYRWPSIYLYRHNVEDGGLMSYGPNVAEVWRSGARQIAKILKGMKPGDLPVEQPTRFDLIINLKTAKALGITVPATLAAQATEVIE
jgi:putative tryptophan/tyrosine transport system substrate-binding protein